jgi:hypothetical protein
MFGPRTSVRPLRIYTVSYKTLFQKALVAALVVMGIPSCATFKSL